MIRLSAALLLSLFGLSACETFKGMGQDMQTAGQTVENEAREAQTNP
ncbi:MAG: entericidin A/B family lipoprotein [Pseudomonadota bacterium]|jgi:predicted small secreted protein